MLQRLCTTTLSATILLCLCGVAAQGQTQPKFNQPGYVQGNAPGEGGYPPPEMQGHAMQGAYGQPGQMPMQGQPGQGQPMVQGPGMMQGQPMQGQPMQGQPMQGQPMQGNMMQGNMQPGMMPGQGMMQGPGFANAQQQAPAQKVNPHQAAKVYQWFLKYDEIRRRAQMDPIEKQRADSLLARGFGLFMPGQDKIAAKQLLAALVQKYQMASQALQGMPPLKETQQLHQLYYQYFETATQLFSDYLKVQDNVFAVDNTGQSIAKQLIQRKMTLENLEHSCKDFDYRMRQAFGVAPYQY